MPPSPRTSRWRKANRRGKPSTVVAARARVILSAAPASVHGVWQYRPTRDWRLNALSPIVPPTTAVVVQNSGGQATSSHCPGAFAPSRTSRRQTDHPRRASAPISDEAAAGCGETPSSPKGWVHEGTMAQRVRVVVQPSIRPRHLVLPPPPSPADHPSDGSTHSWVLFWRTATLSSERAGGGPSRCARRSNRTCGRWTRSWISPSHQRRRQRTAICARDCRTRVCSQKWSADPKIMKFHATPHTIVQSSV